MTNDPPIPTTLIDLARRIKAYQAHVAGKPNQDRFIELCDELFSEIRQHEAVVAKNATAHPTPDLDGLADKLEHLQRNLEGPLSEYEAGIADAIAIVRKHEAGSLCARPQGDRSESSIMGDGETVDAVGRSRTLSGSSPDSPDQQRNSSVMGDSVRSAEVTGKVGVALLVPSEISDVEEESWQALNETLAKRNYIGNARTEFVDEMWEAILPYLATHKPVSVDLETGALAILKNRWQCTWTVEDGPTSQEEAYADEELEWARRDAQDVAKAWGLKYVA